MLRISFVLSSMLLASLFIISACSKAPDSEIKLASAAIDSAMSVKANYYAPNEFEKAKQAFDNARNLISKKKYGQAKNFAILAQKMADSSIVVSKRKRVITEIEIEQLLSYLQHKINVLEKVVSKAENFGVASSEIEHAKQELTELDKTLLALIIKNSEEDYESIRHEGNYAIERASLTTYHLIKLISNSNVTKDDEEEEAVDLQKKSGF